MTIDDQISRLKDGYYNSSPVSDANPGGLAADGHSTNLPALLVDVGAVGEHAGTAAAEAETSAESAATSEANAATSATNAAASASAAATSAVAAADSATAAAASADAAQAAIELGDPALDIPAEVFMGQTVAITITNFDSTIVYDIAADLGTVTRDRETLTYTAPSASGTETITINGRDVSFAIQPDALVPPDIPSPADGAVDIGETVTLASSDFATFSGDPDTHTASQWQIATDSGFTSIVFDSGTDTGNLTSIDAGPLSTSTTYYTRARHQGQDLGWSDWGSAISFTTADSFLDPIGDPGTQAFGVAAAPSLPSGFTALSGSEDPASDNYGTYQYSDGSIMCWVPKFYYRINAANNPTAGEFAPNDIDIKGTDAFATTADAEGAGYVLHRAFIDGGVEKNGFFVDKYLCSPNGDHGSSVKDGVPISLTTSTSYTSSDGMAAGATGILADAVLLSRNRGTGFHACSMFIYSALAMLALAHAQAATSTTHCAWWDDAGTTSYPKGANDGGLGDVDDAEVAYTTAGDSGSSAKPLTGSGAPFAKTTHNGQASGVADLNGAMWETALGLTMPGPDATASSTTPFDQTSGLWVLRETQALADLTEGWDGATDAWQSSANIDTLYENHVVSLTDQSQDWGASGVASLSGDATGLGYITDSLALAVDDSGVSADGTNLFGQDRHNINRRENLVPLVGGNWSVSAGAGVFARTATSFRSFSYASIGFRAAAYGS